jgi:exodeoxyribonuclease V alpha subunit
MTSLEGSVERIVFQNDANGFCVARFILAERSEDSETVTTIVGNLPEIREGETLELEGHWETHPVHGRNFRVKRFQPSAPTTLDAIERYLASGAVTGIGPVTARRLVQQFGERTLAVLDGESHLLVEVAGITERRREVITQSWMEHRAIRELSLFLQEHGISLGLAARLHKKYGNNAISAISSDPYSLARDVEGIGFRTADAIGKKLGIPATSLSRYIAGIRHVLSEAADEGHVFLLSEELYYRASRLLEASRPVLEPALLESLSRGDTVKEGDRVYLAAFHRAESGVARSLQEIGATPSPLTLDRSFDAAAATRAAAESQGLELARKQVEAVELSLTRKVSILTGGPGTGKTSTLRTIISALTAAQIQFCLCAPTGRAAKRVAETSGQEASTIHRLLEYQPGLEVFNYDHNRPLPYDFVIVDEVSMLDIVLFYHLLKAVPREAHLLLVGDADQLPSVGAGTVLKDCIEGGTIPVVTLTELFRQSATSEIVRAAHSINAGETPAIHNGPDSDLYFVRTDDEARALAAIKKLVGERIPQRFGLSPTEDVQVIAPMHAGAVGVASLNAELQSLLNPSTSGASEFRRGERSFRLGDKIMQTRNNYDKDVYNGDVGRLVAIQKDDGTLTVRYPSPAGDWLDVEYASDEVDELTLAYAVSVHKAQGSEFPCVVMPVVPRHSILLQRSLVYTAVSRASRLCILVGSWEVFGRAVERHNASFRNSFLANRLSGREEAPQDTLL